MAKRQNGEGSWGKQKINGIEYHYFVKDGKRTYGKTIGEVKEKLEKKKLRAEKITTPNSNLTFGQYMNAWLETIKTKIEPTTYDGYKDTIDNRIIKFRKYYNIADKSMDELNSNMFQKYLDKMAEHYAHSTIVKSWTLIKMCIKHAEIKNDIKPLYLVDTCHVPKETHVAHSKKEIHVPSIEDCELIYKECIATYKNGERKYGPVADIIILIMETGMRLQEVTALTWNNINFDKCELYVRQVAITQGRSNDIVIQNRTKSLSGNRTIPLSYRAMETLERLYSHRRGEYVCITSNGQLYSRSQIEKALKRILANSDCKCKDYTPHGLRHGFGSILLSEGADIKNVSELLGHSKVSFTYDTYIKIFEKDKIKTIDILNRLRDKEKESDS